MITEQDEQLHPPGTDRNWQESYYFNWAQPDGSSLGLTRIGFNPVTGRGDAMLLLMSRDGVEAVYAGRGLPLPADFPMDPSRGVRLGALTYTMDEALGAWRLRLDSRTKVDLTWKAFTPAIDFAHSFPGDAELAQRHFEQSGTVTGTVTVDGVSRPVDGLGQRDKSWGVRDWAGIDGWEWIAAQFGPDLSFNATLAQVRGRQQPAGFVYVGGEPDAIVDVHVDYTWHRRHQPQAAVITLHVASGATYVARASAVSRAGVLKSRLFIEETPATFEIEVEGRVRHGVGVIEHAHHVGTLQAVASLPRMARVLALVAKEGR